MRKLTLYNLTFYDGVTGKGTCFVWSEVDGKKGSAEIGSIIIKYLKSLRPEIRHVALFCDSCGGQNRNQFVTSALIFTASSLHFDSISINFLEPGHTQMECDSMHSAIETAKRNIRVFSVDEWMNVMKKARRDHPYEVIRLRYNHFFDIKQLNKDIMKQKNVNTDGDKVNWLEIRTLLFMKGRENLVFYNDGDVNSPMKKFNIFGNVKRGVAYCPVNIPKSLNQLYHNEIPISKSKYNNLNVLCIKFY